MSVEKPSRVRAAIFCGALTSGRGQKGAAAASFVQQRQIGVGFRDRDKGDVMVGKNFGQRASGRQIKRVEGDVRLFEQEFERRIGHEVAGRHQGEQAQRRFRPRGVGEMARAAQGVGLKRHPIGPVAQHLLDGREVEPGRRVVVVSFDPGNELGNDRREIAALHGVAGDRSEPVKGAEARRRRRNWKSKNARRSPSLRRPSRARVRQRSPFREQGREIGGKGL